ncbi:MAG: XTP/dITP diphosphatase [Lachnospiraceae bacterium]|nr:XTP/dITP diphosphatase [Lachnospiraceae bacterium]MDD3660575.1 XTP/dITP diphosphatase [Lachnospiraceae bacterium]
MNKKIIFATGNEGKLKEIKMIFADMEIEVVSMNEAGIDVEIEENGSSFEENAVIKAKAIAEICHEIVLADDSGLVIDALGGEPGVYSARYMGENTSYVLKNQNILERMKGVNEADRSARFVCAVAAAFPDGEIATTEGLMEGIIALEPSGENGFGYDPIFYLTQHQCTSADLDPKTKNEISHRGKALEEMKKILVSKLV